MRHEPDWRTFGETIDWWRTFIVLGGSLIYGSACRLAALS